MNRQRVLNIIREPLRMEHEKDLPLIKELVEEFPYFSAPYVLLTKLLSEQKSIYLDKYLKLSASYIGDREVLYNLIHSPMISQEQEPAKAFESKPAEDIKVENGVGETIETKPADNIPVSIHINTPQEIVQASASFQAEKNTVTPEVAETVDTVEKTDQKVDDQPVLAEETDQQKIQDSEIPEQIQETNSHIADDEKIVVAEADLPVADDVKNEAGQQRSEVLSSDKNIDKANDQQIVTEPKAEALPETHEESLVKNEIEAEKISFEADIIEEEIPAVENASIEDNKIIGEANNIAGKSTTKEEDIETVENTSNTEVLSAEKEDIVQEKETKPVSEASSEPDEISQNEIAPAVEITAEYAINENEPAKKKLDFDLGLPPLAAYDYFAFQDKRKPKAADIEPEIAAEQEKKVEESKAEIEAPVNRVAENAPQKPLKFADWLKSLHSNNSSFTASKIDETPKAEASKVAEKAAPVDVIQQPLIIAKPKPERKVKRNEVEDIISKFIQSEPRIKPKPAKFFTPQDVAERSAEEDNTMATETLANIYLKQGLNEKAIEIFKQLMLKYPQKSAYFAVKINEINTNP